MASSAILTHRTFATSHRQLFDYINSRRRIVTALHFDPYTHLQVSRRISNYPQEGDNLVIDPRNWTRNRSGIVSGGGYKDDWDEEEDEEDRSLDLLVRFVQNVFKKVSKKARRAVRSVLPLNISSKLVEFSVNGTIILAFLWVLKAFLEVVCTLGSVVFISILLIRGIWTAISYLQDSRNLRMDGLEDDRHIWTGVRPVT
ncbi:hypothetical protein RJ639_022554 [Escallonia herrerae]|uniref:Uncharacterized protein n=1 Tax=Escallonia herrerae TaxID=1293975 RepID=A0AA89AFX3_9ASTE|nr:hypothetical protein RJ639_022554 [Escallonia herrerae]